MAIGRTEHGTAQSKAANATLSLAGVALNSGDLLEVMLGYETDEAIVSVKWGQRELKLVQGSQSDRGDTRGRKYRARVRDTATRQVVATWAGNMTARAMVVSSYTEASVRDAQETDDFGVGTTDPSVGAISPETVTTVADSIQTAFFVSAGPSGDTPGVAGDGHTLGQRVGTTGGVVGTNITIQETFKILAAVGPVRASLSGATGRLFVASITAFTPAETYTVSKARHHTFNADPDFEQVIFTMADSASPRTDLFEVRLARHLFDTMTDVEVEDWIKGACQWHADRFIEGNVDTIPVDTDLDTRIDTFVGDAVTV